MDGPVEIGKNCVGRHRDCLKFHWRPIFVVSKIQHNQLVVDAPEIFLKNKMKNCQIENKSCLNEYTFCEI